MHTRIPQEEIEVFQRLPDIHRVLDVGARTDTDYLDLLPDIELHAFEPNPDFFLDLTRNIGERKAVLNNFGFSDEEMTGHYHSNTQMFSGSEEQPSVHVLGDKDLPLKTLDGYVAEHKIPLIDFLKVDVEGMDLKVLKGGQNALKITRFLQYEYWNDRSSFEVMLAADFDMHYIGYRNVLCINKHLVPKKVRSKLADWIKEREFALLH